MRLGQILHELSRRYRLQDSCHSLSGGESLFIEEGFDSIDADTLRVAMDALDGLQAMSRNVNVISYVQEMIERIASRIFV